MPHPRHPLNIPLLLVAAATLVVGLLACDQKRAPRAKARGKAPARSPYFVPGLKSTPTVRFTQDYTQPSGRIRTLTTAYRIDAKPVTVAQYRAWLATRPDPAKQRPPCRANRSFQPDATCLKGFRSCRGPSCAVTCVDWCDARAYCEAVGKRLCGRVGGGATPWRQFNQGADSQWHNACTAQSQQRGPAITLGWVWQWEDCCESQAPGARCRTRNSARGEPGRHDAAAQRMVNCGPANAYRRLTHWHNVGFRCCKD